MRQIRETRVVRRAMATACGLALAAAGGAHALTATTEPVPNSMAALGDSITRAFTDCGTVADCPRDSWSTGTNRAIDSHYHRILRINPAIRGHNYNLAVSGAQVADLRGQAAAAAADNVDYVTILIGANDACAATVGAMTPITTFRADFAQAMDSISTGLPNARIFVASVPDLYRLWQLASPIHHARAIWKFFNVCQSILSNPLSMSPAAMERRQDVVQRVMDYNIQLAEECALHAHCKFDDNAVFNRKFPLSDLGTIDYFHPNAQGQTALAKVTYKAGFGW